MTDRLAMIEVFDTGITGLHRVAFVGDSSSHLTLSAYGSSDVWELNWSGRLFVKRYCSQPSLLQRVLRRGAVAHTAGVEVVARPVHALRALIAAKETLLVIDSDSTNVWLVDLSSGRRRLVARGLPAFTAACSTPLQTIALGGYKRIALLGWPSGRLLGELGGHTDGVRDMAFSPDACLLVSVGGESEDEQHRDAIRLWDVQRRTELRSWMWHHLGAVAFHPQGQTIAVGCMMPGAIKLWNVTSDTIETVDQADLGAISALCFSPDGSHLCAANRAGHLFLFEVRNDG